MAKTTPPRFKPAPLNEQQIRDPQVLRARLDEASAAAVMRDAVISERDVQLAQSVKDLDAASAQSKALLETIAAQEVTIKASNTQIAELSNTNRALQAQLDKLTVNRPKIAVDNLVRQFSSGIEKINTEARKAGGSMMLVDNLEVEIKGGIDVADGLRITQLPESAINAESVSTLRFTLKPSTVIRMIDDDGDTELKPGG